MNARFPLVAITALALAAAGCSSMSEREQGTAKGAVIGAGAGAVIGAATGGKAGQSAVIGGAIGAIAGNLWTKRMQDKQAALEKATQGTGIEVARTADNQIKVNVPSDFSFDVGQARIRPDMRPVLDEFARNLDPAMRVRVIGHTDSTGSDSVNQPLSVDRAEAVRDYIAARGVASTRVTVEGHGSREPVADNNSNAGRAMNRRVEIFLREPEQAAG
jgi:outer membrane protein OmpA-like peptidoglycan-associated protein